jgi:tRNA (cmo5U34)-methyltransferase
LAQSGVPLPPRSRSLQDYDFTPESYLSMMRDAVPGYDSFEEPTVAAAGTDASTILELGTGTGETARAVLDKHPDAHITSIDASPGMVRVAAVVEPVDPSYVVTHIDPEVDHPSTLDENRLARSRWTDSRGHLHRQRSRGDQRASTPRV